MLLYRVEKGLSFLKHLKVAHKLILLTAVCLLFVTVVGASGYVYLKQMKSGIEDMYYERLLPVKWTNAARAHLRAAEANTFRMMMMREPAERSILEKEIGEQEAGYDRLLAEFEGGTVEPAEAEMLEKLKNANLLYREQSQTVLKMLKDGETGSAFTKYTTYAAGVLDGMNDLLEKLAEYNAAEADRIHQEQLQDYNRASAVTVLVILLALLLCSVAGFVISRTITVPIRELQQLTAQAAAGDMRVRTGYQARDELGQLAVSFNNMLEDTGEIIRQVHETSDLVAASSEQLTASAVQTGRASEQISTSAQEVAAGAVEQESKVQEGLAAAQQVAELSASVARSSRSVAGKAVQTADVAQDGSRKVREVCERMGVIDGAVRRLADDIRQLEERTGKINGIAAVMKEIAGQTNLLALNASIEAARAGEEGKGFAVVAAEVRKLAEQSIQASQEVQSLVTAIRQQTKDAVQSMDNTSAQVKEGISIVEETDRFFGEIDRSIGDLASRIQEMSEGANEMEGQTVVIGTAIQEIHSIATQSAAEMQHMSASTEEQLATMDEMGASTRQLATMAVNLQALVSRFKA